MVVIIANTQMNTRVIIILLAIVLTAFAACKKSSDAPVANYSTYLNFVNASADSVNYYLNGTRLNSNSNLYPQYTSGYVSVLAFTQNYQVKKVFNTASSTVQPLFTLPLNLDTGKYYSLFIAGESASLAFKTQDDLKADTLRGTCLVRFVNASPDAAGYDLVVGSAPKFAGLAFGTAGDFRLADTSSLAPVTLYPAGSSTPIARGNLTLLQGKSYTIYTTGKLNGTGGSALSLAVMINYN